MFFWKFYCPKCKRIKNRLQVAYGTDNIRFSWFRCRTCGTEVRSLRSKIEEVLSHEVDVQPYDSRNT